MNLTTREAPALVEAFKKAVEIWDRADIVICPPYISLPCVQSVLKGTNIRLGAQDVFWMEKGAFTGQISAPMLKDVGVSHCIVGHSERRGRFGKLEIQESAASYFADTDETVNLKIKCLLYCGMIPILCVGETLAEREAGKTDGVIRNQLTGGLDGLVDAELLPLVVAYEPVWAIGTGQTCDSAEAQRVCAMIRAYLWGISPDLADSTRVLYGGSVKASNARELFAQPDIDGGLVGGASLDAYEFKDIVMSAR